MISLLPAIIGAVVAIKVSSRQINQGWREKKNDVYSKISEDISRLFFCTEELYSESVGEKMLDDHRIDTLNNEFGRRLESLKMILAGGSFIVSKEILTELEVLIKTLANNSYKQQEESFADFLGRNYDAIKKFKDSFNNLAKKELNIKEHGLKGD